MVPQLVGLVVLLGLAAAAGWLLFKPTSSCTAQPESAACQPPADVSALLLDNSAPPATAQAVMQTVLSTATTSRQRLLVGPLHSNTPAASVSLEPEGENDLQRQADLNGKVKLAEGRFADLVKAPASGTTIDGLHALAQHLQGFPHGTVDVVLDGDLQRVAPNVDLRDPVQRGDIDASLSKVMGLVDDCRGWQVHAVGGATTAGQVGDSRADSQTREFWRRFFARCGGHLTLWDNAQLPAFPSHNEVPATVLGPTCTVSISLPADVLFNSNDAQLQPSAQPALQSLLTSLTTTHRDAEVVIDGYTADTPGDWPDPYVLSGQRAASVRQWLINQGVTAGRLTATGHGPQDPIASNETDAGRRLNRRVEVQLKLPGTSCPLG